MGFKEIIGQQASKVRFIQTVKSERISHAQIFYGSEGSGKLKLAIACAQYLSCTNKTENDSCGSCASCRKYEKLIHPDLHFVFPVVKSVSFSKPVSDNYLPQWRQFVLEQEKHRFSDWLELIDTKSGQAGIFAQESNEIIKKLSLKSFESEYKVMIIWLPEKMNLSCANKLLKLIEEPPEKTIFLMISEFPEKIINTIRSRSQFINIPTIEKQALEESLLGKYQMEQKEMNRIIKIANGNYFKILDLIESSDSDRQNFDYFTRLMRLAFGARIIELSVWVDEICSLGREQEKNFLNYCLKMIRENFVLNQAVNQKDSLSRLNMEEENFSLKFSVFIHQNNIFEIYNELNKAFLHIERNGMDKIIFFDLALKIVKLLKRKAAS